jgi:subtilisin family serine protease
VNGGARVNMPHGHDCAFNDRLGHRTTLPRRHDRSLVRAASAGYAPAVRPGFLLASLASLAALASLSPPALAESLGPALVRLLHVPGRPHPLADPSGRVPFSIALPRGADAAGLGLLQVAPGVGAIRLFPDEVPSFAAAHPDLALSVSPRFRPLLDVSGEWTHVTQLRAAVAGLDGTGVVVGIIDTGLDVHHPDFIDAAGGTRVAWMLTGDSPAGLHPDLEAEYGCTSTTQGPCAVFDGADLDMLLMSGTAPIDAAGHGTHVSSIAAGNGGPSVNATPRYVGLAPGATLIVAAPPQAGGFQDTEILNAARFIFGQADAMGLPVVVNISLGSDYGSHDGTSNLETGLEAFVGDDKPGHVIVVAAGNSGSLTDPNGGSEPLGTHTEVHVADGETTRVPIVSPNSVMNAQIFVWVTFMPGDDVEVGLEGPGGSTWVGLTGSGSEGSYADGADTASVVNNLPSADADLTSTTNSAVVVLGGQWGNETELAIVLQGTGTASLWVTGENDAEDNIFFEKPIRQGTINVPASAPGLIAVGCTVNRLQWKPLDGPLLMLSQLGPDPDPVPDSACFFSSEGPTPFGVQKPEISAPGGFVGAAMSAAADPRNPSTPPGGLFDVQGCPIDTPFCAVLDDYHAIAQGTSMSAPHVTGSVALLMQQDPMLTQAEATFALQAGARLSGGHIPDPDQLGPGSLDIDGAWQALVDTSWTAAAPDLAQSWVTLSSAYARPDPTWPVWGTVELRTGSGAIAGNIDGTALALSLRGGTVYQPMTRVRPGLWRFAVAGEPADLDSDLVVDVTYAGTSIGGARTLPVGYDKLSADDPSVGAVSGACTCEAAGRSGSSGGPALLALAGAALAGGAARRRRRAPGRG